MMQTFAMMAGSRPWALVTYSWPLGGNAFIARLHQAFCTVWVGADKNMPRRFRCSTFMIYQFMFADHNAG